MKRDIKRCIFIFLIVSLLIISVYFLNFKKEITGRAILNIEKNYQEGEPLQGILKISLKEGELIPASSKIVFEISNETYEYPLENLTDDETIEGDFYLENTFISGNGLGYGTPGKKITYPPVSFTLRIYSEGEEESAEQIITEEQNVEQTQPEEIITEIPNNESAEIEGSIEEQEITPEITEEQTEIQETEEQIVEEQEETTQEPTQNEGEEISLITGSIIKFFKTVSNFFLGLKPTGHVTMSIENVIGRETSVDKPFAYTLEEGQTAEVVSSSHDVKISIEDDVVTITTDYFEEEKGFGENYLGNEEKILNIDLSKLNLTFEQGELNIIVIYGEEEIISLKTSLKEEVVETEKEEKERVNESIEEEMNETIANESIEEELQISLSDEEKEALSKEFGNSSIKITIRFFNDKIIVRRELKDKWIENSYDATLNEEELKLQMESDRIKWLKDIAKGLLQETKEEKSEKLEIPLNLFFYKFLS